MCPGEAKNRRHSSGKNIEPAVKKREGTMGAEREPVRRATYRVVELPKEASENLQVEPETAFGQESPWN
jgi:hypothetical protein